jgi:uncharacterized membrane protein
VPRLSSRATAAILVGLCAVGLFLRLGNLGSRPFWRDEAWVAEAIRDLPYGQLLRQTDVPLPPLFAVAAKAIGTVCGPPEWAWRLLPALAGLAVVPLAYAAARTLGAPRCIALALTGLCDMSALLVIWSRELKQYALEALFSALIAVLIFRLRRANRAQARWWYGGIVVVALVAPWFAYGAVFPIAALLPLLLMRGVRENARKRFVGPGLAGLAALLVGFLSVWLTAARGQAADAALAEYSSLWYLPLGDPGQWARPLAHVAATTLMLLYPPEWLAPMSTFWQVVAFNGLTVIHVLLAIIGIAFWPRRGRREIAWWVLAPVLAMAVAAALGRYPLGVERMMQFWAPPVLLAIGMGVAVVWRHLAGAVLRRPGHALLTVVGLGVLPLAYMIREPLECRYYIYHDFPAVLTTLEQKRQPGEPVFVELFAAPCVRYYAPDLAPPVVFTPVTAGTILKPGTDVEALARDVARSTFRRFWILDTNEFSNSLDRAELQAIRKQGFNVEVVERRGHLWTASGAAELLCATRR